MPSASDSKQGGDESQIGINKNIPSKRPTQRPKAVVKTLKDLPPNPEFEGSAEDVPTFSKIKKEIKVLAEDDFII